MTRTNPPCRVLITDIDNTLFDWVELWHASFSAMFKEIVRISGIEPDKLKREIRKIHQKHGTSEYAFLMEELDILRNDLPRDEVLAKYSPAIEAYRVARRRHLALYPGVAETLLRIRGAGAKVIGFTESMSFYAAYRIRRLGLDGVIDEVYFPPDHGTPDGVNRDEIRSLPEESYRFRYTKQELTPPGSLKPAPEILKKIMADLRVEPHDCVYLGDSLIKDIPMANDANVLSVHAEYGNAQHLPEYELLRQVSHWTDVDVEREKQVSRRQAQADIILRENILEIFDHIDFDRFELREGRVKLEEEPERSDPDKILAVWKKVVDVQQHFNDIELRIRNIFVTSALGISAAFGLALQKEYFFEALGYTLSLAPALAMAGLFATLLFYLLDKHWYHQLLIGAVKQGAALEKHMVDWVPGPGLTTSISKESPIRIGPTLQLVCRVLRIKDERIYSKNMLHSSAKIEVFYKSVGVVFLLLFAISATTVQPATVETEARTGQHP